MSESAAALAAWSVLSATTVGASHRAHHRPAQDAVNHAPPAAAPDQPVVVAVADGHGHRLHFRSQVGSQLAVEIACDTVLDEAAAVARCETADHVTELAVTRLLPELHAAWRQACLGDLERRPVTTDELEAAGYSDAEQAAIDASNNDPLLAYGSTLMFAGLAGRWAVLAHIGDGDIFTVAADGTAATPVPGDPLLDGSRTTSLCQPDALGSFRTAVVDLSADAPVVIGLATDGYGNAQSSDHWQPAVAADLASYLRTEGRAWIGEQLGHWVERCASAEGSADDTTLALLVAPDAERTVAVTPTATAAAGAAGAGAAFASGTTGAQDPSTAADGTPHRTPPPPADAPGERTLPLAPGEALGGAAGYAGGPGERNGGPGESQDPHGADGAAPATMAAGPAAGSTGPWPASAPAPASAASPPRRWTQRARILAGSAVVAIVAVVIVVVALAAGGSSHNGRGKPNSPSSIFPTTTLPAGGSVGGAPPGSTPSTTAGGSGGSGSGDNHATQPGDNSSQTTTSTGPTDGGSASRSGHSTDTPTAGARLP